MYRNPILYADYSDPDVIRVGEDYYMVASSFTYLPGVPVLHSRDLVHWRIINYCVKALPFEKYDLPAHGSGTWAPSIRFHDGMFYVFIPLPDEGILVARTADIYGEFQLNLLCESKGWIDPCPFWDEDGKAYMVFAYARSRCGIKHRLSLVEIDPECSRLLGQPKVIFDGEQVAPTIEGPKMYRYEGYYYILAPAGGVADGWQTALRSKVIWGPYEHRIVMHQGNTGVNGPHQGGWVTDTRGRHWFLHFQDVGALGRITHLQPMCFVNGWPFIGSEQNGDGIGEPVESWHLPEENQPHYQIATSDDFAENSLGLQWQWQANPKERYFALKKPGLRLNCLKNPQKENLLWYAPNALTQIPQYRDFAATVKLHLAADQPGDCAALGMIGQNYGYLALEKNALAVYRGEVLDKELLGRAEEIPVARQDYFGDTLYLRMEVSRGKYRFFWSAEGECYMPIGGSYPVTQATWTGAKLCLWAANKENRESAGYGEFFRFREERI